MRLDRNGTTYNKVDITTDDAAYARVKALGYSQMPVVEASSENHWSGYSPDRIDALMNPAEPVKELKRDAVVQDRDVVEDKG
jgi:glutaredoxin-like protein NrdH